MADAAYDPGAHTIAEVQEYVTANPDQTAAVRDAEAAGKARTTLLAWLDEPWPEEDQMSETPQDEPQPQDIELPGDEGGEAGGTQTDDGGRPVTDDGGRIVNIDGNTPDEPEPEPEP